MERYGEEVVIVLDTSFHRVWDWKRMLYRFVQNTEMYLKEYFQRNKSESGFAEDKNRCGWKLRQKRYIANERNFRHLTLVC